MIIDNSYMSKNIIIDHKNWDWYNSQMQQVFDTVAMQKIYFAHASIGNNIMSGFEALHSADSSKYPLSRTIVGLFGGQNFKLIRFDGKHAARISAIINSLGIKHLGDPPAKTANGMIYDLPEGQSWLGSKGKRF